MDKSNKDSLSSKSSRIFLAPSQMFKNSPKWKGYLLSIAFGFLVGLLGIWLFNIGGMATSNKKEGTGTQGDSNIGLDGGGKEGDESDEGSRDNDLREKMEIKKLRYTLNHSNSREEVLQTIDSLIEIGNKEAMDTIKLKLLNKSFIERAYQMDLSGRRTANNEPELIPSHRRILKKILRKLANSGNPRAGDILLTLIDTKVFNKPNRDYLYSIHLETLLAIAKAPDRSQRSLEVFRRILQSPSSHKYSRAEKQWALAALKKLGTEKAFQIIMKYIVDHGDDYDQALIALRTIVQSNEKPFVQRLKNVARLVKSPRLRQACYRALAGLPGKFDRYGIRITANRRQAKLEDLNTIHSFLRQRLRKEKNPQALTTLRQAIRRLSLIIDRKISEK